MFLSRKHLEAQAGTIFYSQAEEFEVQAKYSVPMELEAKEGFFTTPRPFVAVFEDVHLLGPGGVGVTSKGDIILETAFAGRFDAAERNPEYVLTVDFWRELSPIHVDLAVPMLGTWSSYYFHWMLEQLPKLEGVDRWVSGTGAWPTLIVQKDPPKFVTETLDMMGHKWMETNGHILAKTLLVPSHRRHQGRTAPGAVRWLRENINRAEGISTYSKMIISRDGASERRLLNEAEVWAAVGSEWGRTMMEQFTVSHQAKYWNELEAVIAPHGGGLANMVFGDKLAIVEIFGSYVNPCFFTLASVCGHNYIPIQGEAVEKDIRVDIEGLVETLAQANQSFY